jgi:putative DNA primase/helicase
LCAAFLRHLALPHGAEVILALWVLHAHTFDSGMVSPRLALKSPEKCCGKTTCLTCLSRLVPRPLTVANITAAAVFRTVEAAKPTILVDEADTFLKGSDELRGIINSGHYKPTAFVVRVDGDEREPRLFKTWAPTAIAVIGNLPDTLEDRSVVVEMRRRRRDEEIDRLRLDRLGHLDQLASMAARWAKDNHMALSRADPSVPGVLHDRAADNWRPLLAIADLAGGDWPQRAREVAAQVATGEPDDASIRVQLLADIQAVFGDHGVDKIASTTLCNSLAEMEDRPWPEWRNGKPITPAQLARMLKWFKIAPGTIRLAEGTPKGYKQEQFEDVFTRYVPSPPSQAATPPQARRTAGLGPIPKRHRSDDVAFPESLKPAADKGCGVVAARNGGSGAESLFEPDLADVEEREAITAIDGEQACIQCGGRIEQAAESIPVAGGGALHPECYDNWFATISEQAQQTGSTR